MLATDLSAFRLYNLKPAPTTISSPMAVVVVDESAKPPVMAATVVKSSPLAKWRMSPAKGKARTGPGAKVAALLLAAGVGERRRCGGEGRAGEAARGGVQGWFLGFVERFLDADAAAAMPLRPSPPPLAVASPALQPVTSHQRSRGWPDLARWGIGPGRTAEAKSAVSLASGCVSVVSLSSYGRIILELTLCSSGGCERD